MENKVHLWIGSNFSTDEQYMQYFEIDYSTGGDFEDPSYKPCGFCKDIGVDWYDEDFIGIIDRKPKDVELDELLVDAAVDESQKPLIKKKCSDLGIKKANAILWYQDEELVLKKPLKENYNGLKYIGIFEGD